MFYNSYGTEQVKFIKDGEDYFEGVLYFDDGVTYTRRKYQTGNTFYELKKDDKILYTNQQGRAFIAVNEVPQEISTYLGVLKDMYTGEKLNIRRCTDRMFLIETSGGDNYKIFNSILRSEALAQATTKMNKDRNSLHQQYVVSLNQLTALQQEYIRAKLPKEEVISRIAVQNKVVKAKSEKAKSQITGQEKEYLEAYVDGFIFPKKRYHAAAGSKGVDGLLKMTYSPNQKSSWQLRYRVKSKEQERSIKTYRYREP